MVACPPLEDIAAFLDGTLSSEERARLTEHLARCESCYEIFAGAVHFQEEEKALSANGTGGRGVLQFPFAEERNQEKQVRVEPARPPRRVSRWLPLAASVVLAVGLGWTGWRLFFAPPEITLADVVEPIETKTRVSSGLLYKGDNFRGPGDPESLFSPGSEFMTGVHLLDLRLSVRAEDVEATASRLQNLGNELQNISGCAELGKRYQDESLKMRAAADLDRFRPQLPTWERELQGYFPDSVPFQFGLWAEAGRLAAKIGAPEFFETRKNRRFLSSLQRALPDQLAPELQPLVLEDLKAIERIWDQGELSQGDYRALASHYQSIIKWIDGYEEDPASED